MANRLHLEIAGSTDTGLVRSQNEDAIVLEPARGFVVLADGMGGYNAGEVASSMATTVTRDHLVHAISAPGDGGDEHPLPSRQLHELMVSAIRAANTAVFEAALAEPEYHGMGTTIIAAVFGQEKITIAHVGDSRGYRFRNNELSKVTRDHSLLQEQIDAGLIDAAMARFSQSKNLVTRAIGVGVDVEVEIHDHQLQPGDLYLLCSDGLSDMLSDEEIAGILANKQDSLEASCQALIKRANDNGGFDNISVVLARIRSTGVEASGILGRILSWVS
ncbi:Stp1/IreP family PP2C-type Ser/Thr phosphatase [Noviherbaspirillum sp. ST9]|uniref:Stp1/IreP family PP2C-type Ser/Thr phosphatase n=1 Tax=Noviherbaspirillum sp. ST9 TaxID=3401606 RepID=UPI003B587FC0